MLAQVPRPVFCKPSAVPAWHYTGICGCLFHSWRQNIFGCERQTERRHAGAAHVETYPNRFMRGQPSHEHVGLQSAASMHGCTVFDPAPSHAALALEWSKLRRATSARQRPLRCDTLCANLEWHFETPVTTQQHKQALSTSARKVAVPRQATQRWRWGGRRATLAARTLRQRLLLCDMLCANLRTTAATIQQHKQDLSASARKAALPRKATKRWCWSSRSCHDGPRRLCAPERDSRNHSTAQASSEQAGMAGCPTSHVVFCKPSAVPAWHYTGISGCLFHSWRQNIFGCERQTERKHVGAAHVKTYPNRFMRGQPSHEHVGSQSAASMDGCTVFDPAPSHAAPATGHFGSAFQTECCDKDLYFVTRYAQTLNVTLGLRQRFTARKVALPRQATQHWRWSCRSCHDEPSCLCVPERTLRQRPLLCDNTSEGTLRLQQHFNSTGKP